MAAHQAVVEAHGVTLDEIAANARALAAPLFAVDPDELTVDPFTCHPHTRTGAGRIVLWTADVTVRNGPRP